MDDEAASLEAYNNAIKDGLTILKNNYFLVLENVLYRINIIE